MYFVMDEIFHYQSFCAENHENKLIAAKKLSVIAVLQGRECNEKELLYRNRQLEPQTSNDLCKHQGTSGVVCGHLSTNYPRGLTSPHIYVLTFHLQLYTPISLAIHS